VLKSKISICIAGKNQCAIDALDFLIKKKKFNLFSLPNDSDTGKNNWQSSFKKFSKSKKIKIVKLSDLCKIKKLFLFSFEYEKIININNFVSKNLYNFHFSLLPKYRGCHTNFLQIFNGEK
jgi:methionyl-tRNA formyltransferase